MTMHDLFDGSDHTLIEEAMSREQFEKEFPVPLGTKYNSHNDEYDTCDEHSEIVDYSYTVKYRIWQKAWQASRAVPVKLPEKVEFNQYISPEQENAINDTIVECADAIRAAGYPVEEAQ